ncbi:MAG: MBL fold metallo-hydrolase [Candidatus Eremiobacterota bacterium]
MSELSVFHFPELFCFNLPVLETETRIFVIDTYMGPLSIKDVLDYCNKMKKRIYAVNTHSHFDHIWGNSAFKHFDIIAHSKCLELIVAEGEEILNDMSEKNPEMVKEHIEITPPNLIFDRELIFRDRDSTVKIKYLPGHSEDSSVIMVMPENILLAGDMVEDPIPLLQGTHIDMYIKNLKYLDEMNFSRVIPSHGKRQDSSLIKDNIYYLEGLKEMVSQSFKKGKKPSEENIKIDSFVPTEITPFYIEEHKNNIKKVTEDLENTNRDISL